MTSLTLLVLLAFVVSQLIIGRIVMAAIDDVTAASDRAVAAITNLLAKLGAAPVDNSAALETLAGKLNEAAAAAEAVLNPAPAPAPAPAPTP